MTVLEELFNRRWIIREYDKELYHRVCDQLPTYQKFLNEKLDYPVIVTPKLTKLEKIPGQAEPWMGGLKPFHRLSSVNFSVKF